MVGGPRAFGEQVSVFMAGKRFYGVLWLVSVFIEVSIPRTCGKQVSVFVVGIPTDPRRLWGL